MDTIADMLAGLLLERPNSQELQKALSSFYDQKAQQRLTQKRLCRASTRYQLEAGRPESEAE